MALILLVLSSYASAHEGRPVYIQLQAQNSAVEKTAAGEQRYQLQWKIPPVMAAGDVPRITLQGSGCETVIEAPGARQRHSLLGKELYRCKHPVDSLQIAVDYPNANPVLSTLVVMTDAGGKAQHVFTGPETRRIDVFAEQSAWQVAQQYAVGGIEHILIGYDHLLFVLCLMVVAGTLRSMIITITGFTLAHTLTLILSTLGVISLPIVFVEMLIALSIVVLAADIIRSRGTGGYQSWSSRYPFSVAVAFGLLHGFGFASVLGDLGLPQSMQVTALLFFNLGVEIGQVFFILVAFWLAVLIAKIIRDQAVQARLINRVIYLVGSVASFWVFQRLLLSL
ncbi:MAG: HupE/UreJ family protein [Pseudomonadota bacterium]